MEISQNRYVSEIDPMKREKENYGTGQGAHRWQGLDQYR